MHREFITKIEGHASLHIDWEGSKVLMEVVEGERLFEGLLVGRPVEELAWITPRICGICSISHSLASLCAIEKVLNLNIKPETALMRKLMLLSQIIQSHSIHLFYLALPDYLGFDSGLDLKTKYPKYFDMVSDIKEVSDDLTQTICGRRLLPTTTKIDAPAVLPPVKKLRELKLKMAKLIPTIEKTIDLFGSLNYPKFNFDMFYASQTAGDNSYCVYGGKYIKATDDCGKSVSGRKIAISDYKEIIKEEVKDISAKYGFVCGKPAMVGALARMAVQHDFIKDKEVLRFLKKYSLNFKNPFYNNLAQAIEMLLLVNDSIALLDKLTQGVKSKFVKLELTQPKSKERRAVGAVEAPRGGLYHEIIVEKGIIKEVNIITPTVQNLSSLKETAQKLTEQTISLPKDKRKRLLEMLIRAYDPCITCAVH